ncbi:MAG TPA: ATP-binding protein [Thermoanaerobaculia bacterium]|jgi:signal transduction histidine kinase|nr:ATP-binding protein [Thermoanaerobaculia bacterium]
MALLKTSATPPRSPKHSSRQQAARRLLAVTEEELRRIVLDLHDGPVQQLFAASSQVALMQRRRRSGQPISDQEWDRHLQQVAGALAGALRETRGFLTAFGAADFLQQEVAELIESQIVQFEAATGNRVELRLVDRPRDVPAAVKITLYRTCQEALANAYRHSRTDRHLVRLDREGAFIVLEVSDEGRGFTPPPLTGERATERQEHIGLRGMRDRVALVGGALRIDSAPGKGTRVIARVPLDG